MVEFIDDLAEIGVDILNPVQTSAAGMDPKTLKSRFGDKVCFWGGIDTQNRFCPSESRKRSGKR